MSNYPGEISKLAPSPDDSKKARWFLPSKEGTGHDIAFNGVSRIALAGKTLDVSTDGGINWTEQFNDPEDEESIHRWNWMITLLSEKKYSEEDLALWVTVQLERWASHFLYEIRNNDCNSLRWESYTVGERISNTVIFHYLTRKAPSGVLTEATVEFVEFLIARLEYKGANTGNHVLNNARAIYLAGSAFDVPEWRTFGAAIIKRELSVLVTGDGFLREGSSHYQFLFTRWMLEIHHFAGLAGDEDLQEAIRPVLGPLVEKCIFFLVYNKEKNNWNIPLFGNISPDFPPEWLIDLPWSELAVSFVHDWTIPALKNTRPTWSDLFGPINRGNKREKRSSHPVSKAFPESGWFRFNYGDHTLFFRFDPLGSPAYVGHHHYDMFHFSLFYKGIPVLTDHGRHNYISNDEWGGFGLKPEAHNTFLIGGVGSLPFPRGRYPVDYAQCKNDVNIDSAGSDFIKITLSSTAFERLQPPVNAKRILYLSAKEFSVEDDFQGTGEHEIKAYFHWDNNIDISNIDNHEWGLNVGEHSGSFNIKTDSRYKLDRVRGGEGPLGWTVHKYGAAQESTTFQVETRTRMPFKVRYSICWNE